MGTSTVADIAATQRHRNARRALGALAASTLAGARAVLREARTAVDLILTDVMLGDERGTDLVADCRRDPPEARVVVMSGYAPEVDASQPLAEGRAAFLAKPFNREDLLGVLRGPAYRWSRASRAPGHRGRFRSGSSWKEARGWRR